MSFRAHKKVIITKMEVSYVRISLHTLSKYKTCLLNLTKQMQQASQL